MISTRVRPFRVLIAPLIWVERVRGRRRIALLALYALIATILGLFAWRASRLSGLPDIGDPFDTAAVLAIDVPEERNAWTLWREASARAWRKLLVAKRLHVPPAFPWPKADDAEALDYLARNAEALELWRKGAERPDAMVIRPADLRTETGYGTLISDQLGLTRIALITASGCTLRGDVAGAWDWYRSALRASRLVGRNGPAILQLVGANEYAMTEGAVVAWAADPRVDAALLRKALDEVRAIDAMTPRRSEAAKIEYLMERRDLEDEAQLYKEFASSMSQDGPGGRESWVNHLSALHRLAWFLGNEPTRTRRLHRLAYENWLAECDLAFDDRPDVVTAYHRLQFYDRPASESAGRVSGATLARLVADSHLSIYLLLGVGTPTDRASDRDRALRAGLVVELASALYQREHGEPPKTPQALVGPYLERLPVGYLNPPEKTPQP
jgi:hypothetical protein